MATWRDTITTAPYGPRGSDSPPLERRILTDVARTEEQRRRLTLVATILGSSLAFLDATVVILALPTIEEDLDLGLSGEQWVYLSYSLALAALYLVGGAVGDRRGRREVFMWGVLGFALASLVCAAAPNGGVLIGGRVLQGIAGAFVTTNSLALLREVYGRRRVARSGSGPPSPASRPSSAHRWAAC